MLISVAGNDIVKMPSSTERSEDYPGIDMIGTEHLVHKNPAQAIDMYTR
jgi:hypothetical protein